MLRQLRSFEPQKSCLEQRGAGRDGLGVETGSLVGVVPWCVALDVYLQSCQKSLGRCSNDLTNGGTDMSGVHSSSAETESYWRYITEVR